MFLKTISLFSATIPDMKYSPQLTGILCASFSVFLWGITFVCTKYLLRSFSAYEILVLRFILAYLTLLISNPARLKLKNRREEFLFMIAGFSGVTAYQFMENIAISYTSASNVSVIVSICPMFTAIFMQIFFKENHLTKYFITGFIIAIAGVSLVSFNGVIELHLSPKGDFLALAAALSWGLYSLCIAKINDMGFKSIIVTRRIFFWALIFMIPLSFLSPVNLSPSFNADRFTNPLNWLNLCFLGIGASAFCFAAWNIACENLGTVRATVGIYLIPVVTIIFAFLALGEKISFMGAAGALLTIAGLFVSELSSFRHNFRA